MTSVIQNLAFQGLLVTIGEEIPSEAGFKKLISYYDVQVLDSLTDKLRILQHIKSTGNLDLEGLVKNLSTIPECEDLYHKAKEILDFDATKETRRESAAYVGIGIRPRELLPEESSPSNRKKEVAGEMEKDKDEVVEEIQCEPADENDMKYINMAISLCKESNDPKTRVGSVLVHPTKGIIGTGYNRMPRYKGQDVDFPWSSKDPGVKWLDTKYGYVINSAISALSDATEKQTKAGIEGSILYTTLFPANRDAQLLVEYGITEIVFVEDVFKEYNFTKASKRIMKEANIKLRRINKDLTEGTITNYHL